MKRPWYWRVRYHALVFASGGLFVFGGCGLNDQQLAAIWQSVITTALTTLVTNALTGTAGA